MIDILCWWINVGVSLPYSLSLSPYLPMSRMGWAVFFPSMAHISNLLPTCLMLNFCLVASSLNHGWHPQISRGSHGFFPHLVFSVWWRTANFSGDAKFPFSKRKGEQKLHSNLVGSFSCDQILFLGVCLALRIPLVFCASRLENIPLTWMVSYCLSIAHVDWEIGWTSRCHWFHAK